MKLTPTQDLIMEVLVARVRLGEPFWHFERRNGPALRGLAEVGYVRVDDGVTDMYRVTLLAPGREAYMSPTYTALASDLSRAWRKGRKSMAKDMASGSTTPDPYA